jgi:hypothetical protein
MNIEHMSLYITEENNKKMRLLKTKRIEAFEYEGLIFKGNSYDAKIEFFFNNPEGGDFYVWLQDNREIIGQTK